MINQLVKGIKEKDAPIVVGLDPMLSYVPITQRAKDLLSSEISREAILALHPKHMRSDTLEQ